MQTIYLLAVFTTALVTNNPLFTQDTPMPGIVDFYASQASCLKQAGIIAQASGYTVGKQVRCEPITLK